MRIRVFQSFDESQKEFETWHPWFAWHPVFIDGVMVWLETVERKRESSWYETFWEYRIQNRP